MYQYCIVLYQCCIVCCISAVSCAVLMVYQCLIACCIMCMLYQCCISAVSYGVSELHRIVPVLYHVLYQHCIMRCIRAVSVLYH